MKNTLNILVSTDRNYLKYLRVLMVSVYENHPEQKVDFYVLHDELNADDEAYLNEVAEKYGQKVILLEVDPTVYDDFPFSDRWSKACLYILMAHQFLPKNMERILYLDIDIAVNGNLNRFYEMDFDDCFLIASKTSYDASEEKEKDEIPYEKVTNADVNKARGGGYFNSGALLYNLEKFRNSNIDIAFYEKIIEKAQGKPIFYDQGMLNLAFAEKTKMLKTCRYNYRIDFSVPDYFTNRERFHKDEKLSYTFYPVDAGIVHYCGVIPKANKAWDWYFESGEIGQAVNTYNDVISELVPYFNIWWKYAEKVSDYAKIKQRAVMLTQAYILQNRTLKSNKLDFANGLNVETLTVPAVLREKNSIKEHDDLNNYLIPKVYRCADGKTKQTLKNLPNSFAQNVGFRMVVKQIAAAPEGATALIQILEPNLPDVPVYRRYFHGVKANRWGQWYRLATDIDIAELRKATEEKPEETKKIHVSIFGACTSRDIFSNHENDGGYIVDRYESFISPISMVSQPCIKPNDELQDLVMNMPVQDNLAAKKFVKRNIYLDLSKNYWTYFSEKKSDYFLLDISDIRLPVVTDENGCILTCRALQFPLMHYFTDKSIFTVKNKRVFNSYTDDEVRESIKLLVKKVTEMYEEHQIILLEPVFTKQFYDVYGNVIEFTKGWNTKDIYTLLQKSFRILKQLLPNAHVIPAPNNVIADAQNKWGIHPMHLEIEYYHYALKVMNVITSKCTDETSKIQELKKDIEFQLQKKRLTMAVKDPVRFAQLYHLDSFYCPHSNNITENMDMNCYNKPGAYRCVDGSVKCTLKNLPVDFVSNVGFRLTVKQIGVFNEETASLIQILEPNLPNVPVYRRYYHGMKANKWGPWLRLSTDADLEALTQTSTAQADRITQLTEQLSVQTKTGNEQAEKITKLTEQLSAQAQTNTEQAEQITQLNEQLSAQAQTNTEQAEQITQLNEQLSAQAQTNTEQAEQITQLNEQIETMQNEMAAQKKLLEALAKAVLR